MHSGVQKYDSRPWRSEPDRALRSNVRSPRSFDWAGFVERAPFLSALAVVLLLKWTSLGDPPFWDAAMGLFPAAITLAGNGFDLVELLGMPGYLDGGPNAHGMSPIAWITALVLAGVGGGTGTWVILHLLHLSLAAWSIAALYRLTLPILGSAATVLFCLSVLLHPTFSAQVGGLYLEVALFLCAVSALRAWAQARFWPAVLWATAAWTVKETGIIVVVALAVVTTLEDRPAREKLRRILAVALPPGLWTGVTLVLARMAARGPDAPGLVPSLGAVFGGLRGYLGRFLLNVPDVLVYIVVFAAAAAASAGPVVTALRGSTGRARELDPEEHRLLVMGYSGILVAAFVLLFIVVLPALAGFTIILPRYYVVVLPFLLLWLGLAVRGLARPGRPDPAVVLFAALSIVFAINTNGALYPPDVDTEGPGNDPALTERSNAYRRLMALELDAVRALEELPPGVPVYYGHFEHYLFRYPELGYALGPLSDGHDFSVESLSPLASSATFPPCVYALYNYPWLGGRNIKGLIDLPTLRPELTTEEVGDFRDGRYVIRLARIRRRDADCPS